MAPITASVDIARSPEDVFAYISDLHRHPEWQEGLVSVTPQGGLSLRGELSSQALPRSQRASADRAAVARGRSSTARARARRACARTRGCERDRA